MVKRPEHIDVKYNLTKYFEFLFKYKFLFIMLLIVVLFIESLSIANNFLFKKLVDDGTLFSAGTIVKSDFIHSLTLIAIIFTVVFVITSIIKGLRLFLVTHLETRLIQDLKVYYFNHIISLSHDFFTTHKSGSLISKLTRGGRAVEHLTDVIAFNFAPLFFQIIVVGASLAYFDFISAIVILVTIFLFVLYSYIVQLYQRKYQAIANDSDDFEKAKIADFMTNVESIKYFGKENYIKKKYLEISAATKKSFFDFWNIYAYLDMGQAFILGVGTFFILFFPILKVLNGEMTLGTLVFIYTAFVTLLGPLNSFVYGMREFYSTMGDFESLFSYGKIDNDIKNKTGSKDIQIKKASIKFENVFFKYGNRVIFKDFSLDIKPGQKVAIVGHSGSGKSTLIKLLYRFYDVNTGRILIDNTDLRDVKQESLREQMSIVPQECVLFDDSIYNNIAFSNPDAKREDVLQAIKFAQLDKIIEKFSEKENTIVGERGIKLSGGEKQRVSIARALLANKKILILDEATSSLDSETEYEIQRDLEKLMEKRTSILIAHRLSTILHSDMIVVMKSGEIIQIGKHKDLIKKKGEYQKLWKLQKGGYIK